MRTTHCCAAPFISEPSPVMHHPKQTHSLYDISCIVAQPHIRAKGCCCSSYCLKHVILTRSLYCTFPFCFGFLGGYHHHRIGKSLCPILIHHSFPVFNQQHPHHQNLLRGSGWGLREQYLLSNSNLIPPLTPPYQLQLLQFSMLPSLIPLLLNWDLGPC